VSTLQFHKDRTAIVSYFGSEVTRIDLISLAGAGSLSCVVTQNLPVEATLCNLHTIWLGNAMDCRMRSLMCSLHDWCGHGDTFRHQKYDIFHFAYFAASLSAVCKVTSSEKFGCQETRSCLPNLYSFMGCSVERLYLTVAFHRVQWLRLALSKGPNWLGVFPHLRTETDPVSETLSFFIVI
jgi:hypothetical protein